MAALALDARVGPGASKETVAQLLQANVPGLVVNPGAYASTTAMAMYAQESALNKTMVDVVGLATAGMPYQFWGLWFNPYCQLNEIFLIHFNCFKADIKPYNLQIEV